MVWINRRQLISTLLKGHTLSSIHCPVHQHAMAGPPALWHIKHEKTSAELSTDGGKNYRSPGLNPWCFKTPHTDVEGRKKRERGKKGRSRAGGRKGGDGLQIVGKRCSLSSQRHLTVEERSSHLIRNKRPGVWHHRGTASQGYGIPGAGGDHWYLAPSRSSQYFFALQQTKCSGIHVYL